MIWLLTDRNIFSVFLVMSDYFGYRLQLKSAVITDSRFPARRQAIARTMMANLLTHTCVTRPQLVK